MASTSVSKAKAISRTSSVASVSSDDVDAGADASRRTRKRFSNLQLTMLEELYHRTSHPTREEREVVASNSGMYGAQIRDHLVPKRRQAERRAALHTAGASIPSAHAQSSPLAHANGSTTKTPSTARRRREQPHALSSPYAPVTPTGRPNLEAIATRSELRTTPTRRRVRDPNASLWDNMPSSPLAPPSPPQRDGACAAARLAGKEGGSARARGNEDDLPDLDDETDEEPQEAITPMGSLGSADPFWVSGSEGKAKVKENEGGKGNAADDEVMSAALVLCGLGRGV
ncbi:hypothetical protein EVG20_g2088 [Dentipellis fragilis]|uniref:Homeobox domain-containing protein n=1 Tax=Dentipellis fragilis TaxID=205917 RepID=A0A4Y9Z8Z9_9AGAM|nr:hypothetical protein EVG20_g2088 [Dentipellis fragilis]